MQQGKQRGGVRVEHTKRTENNDARSAKALIAEGSKVDQRIRDPQLAPDKRAETEHEYTGQHMHAIERIAEPVPLLPFYRFSRTYGIEMLANEYDVAPGGAQKEYLI